MSENTLTGVSVVATPYSNGLPTNWACPLPNFTSFIGSSSDLRSAGDALDCTAGQLAPLGDLDGIGWSVREQDRDVFQHQRRPEPDDRGAVSVLQQRPPGRLQHGVLRRRRPASSATRSMERSTRRSSRRRAASCRFTASRCPWSRMRLPTTDRRATSMSGRAGRSTGRPDGSHDDGPVFQSPRPRIGRPSCWCGFDLRELISTVT